MSAIEETKSSNVGVKSTAKPAQASVPVLTQMLNLLSSVRFGVTLLVLLVIACMIGMLIMQQSVEGFDKYYVELTPSQQLLYGTLGFFDIYHSWYFNLLLLVLSLNIVLASIDRFPKAWTFIKRKKLDASRTWLKGQEQHAVVSMQAEDEKALAQKVSESYRSVGLKPTVSEKNGRTYVFAERGAWNRLGAYAVHVALLTIFTGGFISTQFGSTGQMQLVPGDSSQEMTKLDFNIDKQNGALAVSQIPLLLPFTVECTDVQQKLIRRDGPITADNTIDWLTRIKITDERGTHEALVHMNDPYDYRGYRFFQASFIGMGSARNVTLRVTPAAGGAGQDIQISRLGSTTLADGTKLEYVEFMPDFRLANGKASTESGEYNNPAALLRVTTPDGQRLQAYAFNQRMADNAPFAKQPVGGYTYRLLDFEKAPYAHILSIQHDPGMNTVYLGFFLLPATLCAVFFFSHQRVWALIEPKAGNNFEVVLGGNTNRNKLGFEDRFKRLTNVLSGKPAVAEQES
jgi:cytochrome c biogenesis protein